MEKPTENNTADNVDKLLEDLEVNEDEEHEDAKLKNDDFIDEVYLKDLEVDQTETQLEERRSEALSLKDDGNKLFKEEMYTDAAQKYTSALRTCPLKFEADRSILYANRAACYMKIDKKVEAVEDCSKAIELNSSYLKAYKRRAALYEELDKLDEALDDYKKVYEMDSSDQQAATALKTLPPRITEKNEKLKEQMLGTLKDLGNKVLGAFGLSTDNFKLQQDPNTGGYTVNFSQNK